MQGSLLRPAGLRNPGGFNYRAYLANHRIFGLLRVKEEDVFRRISPNKGFSFAMPIFKFKEKLHKIIFSNLKAPQAALLSAILLGERTRLSENVKDLFIKTGTIHILAISGLHIGLMALILVAVFRFLRLGAPIDFYLDYFSFDWLRLSQWGTPFGSKSNHYGGYCPARFFNQ